METAEINLLHGGFVTPEECKCEDPCYQTEYKPTIHLMEYPSLGYEVEHVQKARRNALQIEVYYEGLKFHRFTEIQAYSITQLLSAIGRLEVEQLLHENC